MLKLYYSLRRVTFYETPTPPILISLLIRTGGTGVPTRRFDLPPSFTLQPSVSASPALYLHGHGQEVIELESRATAMRMAPITPDIRSTGGSKNQRRTRSSTGKRGSGRTSHRYSMCYYGNEEPADGLSCMDVHQDARLCAIISPETNAIDPPIAQRKHNNIF